jgi:hypothetical protein
MGLIDGLVTLPLAPLRGTVWLGERLERLAYEQATDPAIIRGQLAEIEEAHENGELSDEEVEELEEPLLRLLLERERQLEPEEM